MLKQREENEYTEKGGSESARIYLQVENPEEKEEEIDIVNIAVQMAKRRKLYGYLFAAAVCMGILCGLLLIGIGQMKGRNSYAQAVITFQYEGIEEGLDPNGAAFDINKLKSPVVIEQALADLGITDVSVETVRENIEIEGVIPADAVERITMIREMAEKDVSNYEKILDVSYFPSQYAVSLYQDGGMSGTQTRDILNAVLESYRKYFLDTYANTDVLTVTGNLIAYEDYDYGESVDMLRAQMEIMSDYVSERNEQAPDFRSSNTGLSFGDIVTSLETIESVDLANLSSYVESNVLTKNRQRQIEYYDYRIKTYQMELTELETQLSTVQKTLDDYEKTPVIIVSGQENTQEITQTDEYYDTLVNQKIALSSQVARVNTELNEAYRMREKLTTSTVQSSQKEFDTADEMLERLTGTIVEWTELIEKTTEEYYTTTLFSNAVKIAVPSQYKAAGGIIQAAEKILLCVAVIVLFVAFIWCVDGLRLELTAVRHRKKKEEVQC